MLRRLEGPMIDGVGEKEGSAMHGGSDGIGESGHWLAWLHTLPQGVPTPRCGEMDSKDN